MRCQRSVECACPRRSHIRRREGAELPRLHAGSQTHLPCISQNGRHGAGMRAHAHCRRSARQPPVPPVNAAVFAPAHDGAGRPRGGGGDARQGAQAESYSVTAAGGPASRGAGGERPAGWGAGVKGCNAAGALRGKTLSAVMPCRHALTTVWSDTLITLSLHCTLLRAQSTTKPGAYRSFTQRIGRGERSRA